MKARMLAIALMMATLAACVRISYPIGVPLPRSTRFETEWKHYLRLRPNKAMAVAGDMSGTYVTGYAFGYPNELAAVDAALEACEARRRDKRIDGQCRTHAIGDQPNATASAGGSVVR